MLDMTEYEKSLGTLGEDVHMHSQDSLKRRLIHDVVPCSMIEDVELVLDLTPSSEEVDKSEHSASHDRLNAIGPLGVMINSMSQHAAEAVRGAMIVQHGDIAAEAPLLSSESLQQMIYMGALGILAELVDLKAVQLSTITGVQSSGG